MIITQDADQYKMDFTKCIDRLKLKEDELGQTVRGMNGFGQGSAENDILLHPVQFDIVAFPSLGGRFDQTMQNINMLYMMKDQIERRMVLVSDENLTILLDKVIEYLSEMSHCAKAIIHWLGVTSHPLSTGIRR